MIVDKMQWHQSFVGTKLMGNVHLDVTGFATPASYILSTSLRSSFLCSGARLYGAECLGYASGALKTIRCSGTVIRPGRLSCIAFHFLVIFINGGL